MLNIAGAGVGDFELSWSYVSEKIFLEQVNYYGNLSTKTSYFDVNIDIL